MHLMRRHGDYSVVNASATEGCLRRLIARHKRGLSSKNELRIEFNHNSSTMVSLSRKGQLAKLRIHWLFTKAPPDVLEAVVRCFFAREDGEGVKRLRCKIFDFIEENRDLMLSILSPLQLRSPRGRTYHLAQIEESLRQRFPIRCRGVRIGWSGRVTPCLMGKWIAMPKGSRNVIIINRLLDDPRVPRYYLEYIVFHELLHEVIPIRREGGKWVHHSMEFRRLERQFPAFERARRWERKNIFRLFATHSSHSREARSKKTRQRSG